MTGGVISTLKDKSGNERNASSINSPLLIPEGFNGLSIGRVASASQDRWSVDLDFLAGSGQNHTCVAAYQVSPTTDGPLYGAANSNFGSGSLHCGYTQLFSKRVVCNYWGNDVMINIPAWFRQDMGNIYSILWNTAGNREIRLNGRLSVRGGSTSIIGAMAGGGRIFGVVTGGTSPYGFPSADLYEMFICLRLLSEREMAICEGYYAWKWGLPLVGEHPFANRPPLIGD